MNENDLLQGVTDALTLRGWRWSHPRRSDKAVMMGHAGVPDILAARNGRVLFIELKSETGRLSADQAAWFAEFPLVTYTFTALVLRPSGYDAFLETIR